MRTRVISLLLNFIALTNALPWQGESNAYSPLSNFYGTRREYTPFEKKLYSISGTADRDCGGEMNMCYEVQGKSKPICAVDAFGSSNSFPNMCEMQYSNCMMDKENWRYADQKKCGWLSRRFESLPGDNPTRKPQMIQTTNRSPYLAQMVKDIPQFQDNRPNLYPNPGMPFPPNAGYDVYPGNPSGSSNIQPNAFPMSPQSPPLSGIQRSVLNQGMTSGYPYNNRTPMLSTQQGQYMPPATALSTPIPPMPRGFIPPMPLGYVPSTGHGFVPPPEFLPTVTRNLETGLPPNVVPPKPPGYIPRKPSFIPPMPPGLQLLWPPGVKIPTYQEYLAKFNSDGSPQMSPGNSQQSPQSNDVSMRRAHTEYNTSQQLQETTSVNGSITPVIQEPTYPLSSLSVQILSKMINRNQNITSQESISKLLELLLINNNVTLSAELHQQMANELERAYNTSIYKDLFNYSNKPFQQPARRENKEIKSILNSNSQKLVSSQQKQPYKLSLNEKEVYDQAPDSPEDDSNKTLNFVPEVQVANEYGDVEEFIGDLDIGF